MSEFETIKNEAEALEALELEAMAWEELERVLTLERAVDALEKAKVKAAEAEAMAIETTTKNGAL